LWACFLLKEAGSTATLRGRRRVFLGSGALEEALESALRVALGRLALQQPGLEVVLHHDAVAFGGELFDVGLCIELTLFHTELNRPCEAEVERPKPASEFLSNGPFSVIPLRGSGEENTAAGKFLRLNPTEPIVEDGDEALLTALLLHCRKKNGGSKVFRGRVENVELQLLLRLEVSEEATLGEADVSRELSDSERLEPDFAREGHRVLNDPGVSFLSLSRLGSRGLSVGHGQKIARPFVLSRTS